MIQQPQCTNTPKPVAVILVKKGMAKKAFLKYVQTGDKKNLERQFKQGIATKVRL